MDAMRYLLVGGGNTAHAAARGIREHDPNGAITIVGAEAHPPYKRPPLTKGLWSGGDEAKIWLKTEELGGVDLRLRRRIVSIDPAAHVAVDDQGGEIRYEKLLLATGGRPRELPDAEGVVYFRTLDDYRLLRERAGGGKDVVVIGGGFIGSELAASLVGAGAKVTMVFPEPAIGWRLFPAGLAQFVTGYYRDRGVEVLTDETVAGVAGGKVQLGSGHVLDADLVVAGLGIVPRTELAEAAGLPVDNGVVVDEHGRVEGSDDVYAAGDVASFPAPLLDKRLRVEHEDHANAHGKLVGANMAGADAAYDYLPFFYSDLFDLGYEAVGEVDSRLDVLEHWVERNREGTIAYVDDAGRPRGYLLWNTWGKVDAARDAIRAAQPIQSSTLA